LFANAVVEPVAVMVKAIDAFVADYTVFHTLVYILDTNLAVELRAFFFLEFWI